MINLEKKFKRGWHETNEFVKFAVSCDWHYITDDLINSVSAQIMEEIKK